MTETRNKGLTIKELLSGRRVKGGGLEVLAALNTVAHGKERGKLTPKGQEFVDKNLRPDDEEVK